MGSLRSLYLLSDLFTYLLIYLFFIFGDKVSLSTPGCPRTGSVDLAPPASTSQFLGLKA